MTQSTFQQLLFEPTISPRVSVMPERFDGLHQYVPTWTSTFEAEIRACPCVLEVNLFDLTANFPPSLGSYAMDACFRDNPSNVTTATAVNPALTFAENALTKIEQLLTLNRRDSAFDVLYAEIGSALGRRDTVSISVLLSNAAQRAVKFPTSVLIGFLISTLDIRRKVKTARDQIVREVRRRATSPEEEAQLLDGLV